MPVEPCREGLLAKEARELQALAQSGVFLPEFLVSRCEGLKPCLLALQCA